MSSHESGGILPHSRNATLLVACICSKGAGPAPHHESAGPGNRTCPTGQAGFWMVFSLHPMPARAVEFAESAREKSSP